ncbi:TetR/AcrR family transcriptional regulator [Virgibacillus sp. MSJ-26]|uniref:TetR/AcrR family transcriptional regulator n=1 Tax=Virgibacillus sp. MSJ-26 TaxID=2841522 RepID=UPI001C10A63B|nr:TetR/AcrR family transcriptional regulator [Virgibacillus sp. MSJ-26]MBU5466268.1 TetR/AcrR family transcriptional regulator [Virgibacillus sp. MSJ-26]
MRDVTERIFKGAISVFIKKGLQATTQEVANEAGVAEVTLYRKFSTKENLFITAIKNVLEKKFQSHILELAKEKETEIFIANIIEDRLEILSKNYELVKMLLSESLKGNLVNEINLPEIIFSGLKKGLEYHFKLKNQTVDIDFCARQLGGIFLSYVVLPNEQRFNKRTAQEKKDISIKHAKSVLATI